MEKYSLMTKTNLEYDKEKEKVQIIDAEEFLKP